MLSNSNKLRTQRACVRGTRKSAQRLWISAGIHASHRLCPTRTLMVLQTTNAFATALERLHPRFRHFPLPPGGLAGGEGRVSPGRNADAGSRILDRKPLPRLA